MKHVEHAYLPAWWACVLINGDTSGMRPDDLAEFQEWAGQNPRLLNPVSCSDETLIGRWNGLTCELLTYTYLKD